MDQQEAADDCFAYAEFDTVDLTTSDSQDRVLVPKQWRQKGHGRDPIWHQSAPKLTKLLAELEIEPRWQCVLCSSVVGRDSLKQHAEACLRQHQEIIEWQTAYKNATLQMTPAQYIRSLGVFP